MRGHVVAEEARGLQVVRPLLHGTQGGYRIEQGQEPIAVVEQAQGGICAPDIASTSCSRAGDCRFPHSGAEVGTAKIGTAHRARIESTNAEGGAPPFQQTAIGRLGETRIGSLAEQSHQFVASGACAGGHRAQSGLAAAAAILPYRGTSQSRPRSSKVCSQPRSAKGFHATRLAPHGARSAHGSG